MDILFYKLQDEINDVKKTRTLTAVEGVYPLTVTGVLRGSASKVAPTIEFSKDITYFNDYNYCYIPDFKRYYFVDNPVSIRTGYCSLDFRVDVLTSFLTQTGAGNLKGYVFRSENKGKMIYYDDRVPLNYQRTIREYKPYNVNYPIVNFSFLNNNGIVSGGNGINYVFEILNKDQFYTPTQPATPTITGIDVNEILPKVTDSQFCAYNQSVVYVTTLNNISQVLTKCITDTTFKSNVKYITAYPFTIPTVGEYPTGMVDVVYGKNNETIDYTIGGNTVHVQALKTLSNNSGYLVLADFILRRPSDIPEAVTTDFTVLDKSMISYELWLPYFGWASIPCEYVGHRLVVYYTINYSDGSGTVNIACFGEDETATIDNISSNCIVLSKSVQIGVRIPVDASNNTELTARKQASLLNTVVGVGAGALVTYAGYKTHNYRTMAYGAGSAVASIASYANTKINAIDKAEAVVPSGDLGLYLPQEVRVRFTYNAKQDNFDRDTFKHFNGYPCNRTYSLSELSGYTEIDKLHTVDNTNVLSYLTDITYSEYIELENLLKQGVYM